MIPVLVDGVKKYLLTEEEVDAKISASSGGSSSEKEVYSISDDAYNSMKKSTIMIGDQSANVAVELDDGSVIRVRDIEYMCKDYILTHVVALIALPSFEHTLHMEPLDSIVPLNGNIYHLSGTGRMRVALKGNISIASFEP